MTNITISIDDALYASLEKRRQGMSLQSYVEKLLRAGLTKREETTAKEKIANYEVSDFIKSLQATDGDSVPANENGTDARIEKYL